MRIADIEIKIHLSDELETRAERFVITLGAGDGIDCLRRMIDRNVNIMLRLPLNSFPDREDRIDLLDDLIAGIRDRRETFRRSDVTWPSAYFSGFGNQSEPARAALDPEQVRLNEAYLAGKSAKANDYNFLNAGIGTMTTCPYPAGTAEQAKWVEGYNGTEVGV